MLISGFFFFILNYPVSLRLYFASGFFIFLSVCLSCCLYVWQVGGCLTSGPGHVPLFLLILSFFSSPKPRFILLFILSVHYPHLSLPIYWPFSFLLGVLGIQGKQ